MKNFLFLGSFLFFSGAVAAQIYDRAIICDQDTLLINRRSMKSEDLMGNKGADSTTYKAISCTQISKFGLRMDLGFSHYRYNRKTQNWLGNHNGALVGIAFVWANLKLGGRFKPATVHTRTALDFNWMQLPGKTKLNPVKMEIDLAYSINLKYNISIESFIAMTLHDFIVIDKEKDEKDYNISKLWSPTVGVTINKYFPLSDRQFISIFVRYGYGLADFGNINKELDFGYSDISIGLGLKGFAKRTFLRKI